MAKTKTHPKGELIAKARGKEYRLHFGMSVIADLQAKYGDKLEAVLTSAEADGALPDMRIVLDIFLGALQRHHGGEADRWLVDDIVAENSNMLPQLLGASFPDAGEEAGDEGNGKAAA